jgi:defect in organelle trafficking protein DotB
MLDRPSRPPVAASEPEMAPDPYAWVDSGDRWVKEPRRLAPALDSFLAHAHRLGAEQVMFSTFQPASFRLWGQNRKVKTRDPLDENDASLIVNHLYGADGMARLQGGDDINLMYQIGSPRKGTLRFRCNVTATTASRGVGANVVIRPVRDLPQPLDQQNVESQILAHYRMTKGLMIVSGATGSGKSTLIGAMTVEKLRDPDAHRNIIECAEPVEFLLDRVESPTSSISQSEIPRNVKSFEDFMAGAMRRQPTDIIIGMIATIQAAISGHATATTIHAETVPLTMQRVASLLPPAQLKDAMTSCSQALRLVINQRLVKSTDGKWTPLREFLVCDAPYRKRLASARADDWPQITAEAVEGEGQSYAKAIAIALKEERIDEETAERVRQEIG